MCKKSFCISDSHHSTHLQSRQINILAIVLCCVVGIYFRLSMINVLTWDIYSNLTWYSAHTLHVLQHPLNSSGPGSIFTACHALLSPPIFSYLSNVSQRQANMQKNKKQKPKPQTKNLSSAVVISLPWTWKKCILYPLLGIIYKTHFIWKLWLKSSHSNATYKTCFMKKLLHSLSVFLQVLFYFCLDACFYSLCLNTAFLAWSRL